ncbi:MAG: hypothetical protein PVG90_13780 [Bacillota bacterium]|jgi:hypothetical protein
MTDTVNEVKTLQMLVENDWTVDSISSLGSGYYSFLVYQEGEIAPEVLADLRSERIDTDTVGEIIQVRCNSGRRVATVALKAINDYHDFVRWDFIILSVIPFLRGGPRPFLPGYQCFYRQDSV